MKKERQIRSIMNSACLQELLHLFLNADRSKTGWHKKCRIWHERFIADSFFFV